ncbi:hypothetical protein ACJX0J_009042, partial [Zea mays]
MIYIIILYLFGPSAWNLYSSGVAMHRYLLRYEISEIVISLFPPFFFPSRSIKYAGLGTELARFSIILINYTMSQMAFRVVLDIVFLIETISHYLLDAIVCYKMNQMKNQRRLSIVLSI